MQYSPVVADNRAAYISQAANTQADMYNNLGQNIGNALASIGGMYAKNKAMEAEATGYDKIGEILGSSMFKDNAKVGELLGNLRKEKNMQAKIFGYKSFFDMTGPISNSMMAQNRFDVAQAAPYAKQALDNAKTRQEEGNAYDLSKTK